MAGADLTGEVTTTEPYVVPATGQHRFTVAAVDLGIKRMTPLRMAERGIETHVLPATSSVEEVLATGADGVFLSNGPGDPATADRAVALTADLLEPRGAGLRDLLRQPGARPGARAGHLQAALRAPRHQPAGAGPRHRAGRGRRPTTTASRSTPPVDGTFDTPFGLAEVSHVCLNDDVVEGLRCRDVPAFSVQYHPEAAAGPHDASYLFDRFTELLGKVA